MKLYVMDNGHNENDFSSLVATPFPLTKDNKTPRAAWVKAPVYTVLIEHKDGILLFDTACHPSSMTERWSEQNKQLTPHFSTEEQLLPNTLKRLGYKPEDVTLVVASHLHEDHAGCLEMFTNSKIFVHEDEFGYAMTKYGLNREMGAYIRKDIEGWIEGKLNWELIPSELDSLEILEGVSIINLGAGHVAGVLGLLVNLPKTGSIILTSDAINTQNNYEMQMPGIVYDSLGFIKCVKKVRALQQKYKAQVWFSHDEEQFSKLIKSDDGFYD